MASRRYWGPSPLPLLIDPGHLSNRQVQLPVSFEIDMPEEIVNDEVDVSKGFGIARITDRTIATLATSIGGESVI